MLRGFASAAHGSSWLAPEAGCIVIPISQMRLRLRDVPKGPLLVPPPALGGVTPGPVLLAATTSASRLTRVRALQTNPLLEAARVC